MCEIESRSLRSKAGYLGGLGVERGGNTYALVGDATGDGVQKTMLASSLRQLAEESS